MRPTQVVPSLEDLGLTPSDPERYHFCKCPTLCGRWAQHPLGQGLHAFIYDVHRAKEVIRLETRFVHGYSAAHAAAGMLPPSTLLALHGWGERRGGGLLALGGQACELGPGCVLRWEDLSEALKLAKEGSGTQVQCSEHKRLGGVCAAFYGEGAGPFDVLFEWKGGQPVPDWSSRYAWLDQVPPPPDPARHLSQSATPPLSPFRLTIRSSQPDLPVSRQQLPQASLDTDTDADLEIVPLPPKRPRLNDERARRLDALEREVAAARAQLLADQEAEDEAAARRQQEVAERRVAQQARDRQALNEYAARLEECRAEPDASVGFKLWAGAYEEISARRAADSV